MPYTGDSSDGGDTAELHIDTTLPEAGAWCRTCALPSAYAATVTELDADGVTPIGTVTYCPECREWDQRDLGS